MIKRSLIWCVVAGALLSCNSDRQTSAPITPVTLKAESQWVSIPRLFQCNSRFLTVESPGILKESRDLRNWKEIGEIDEPLMDGICVGESIVSAAGEKIVQFNSSKFTSHDVEGLPSEEMLLSVEHDVEGGYLALGGAGGIAITTDGNAWRYVPVLSDQRRVHSAAYGKGLWVVVGANELMVSADKEKWKKVNISTKERRPGFRAVTFSQGKWIVVGDRGTIYTSPDLENWIVKKIASDASLRAISHFKGTWIIAATNGLIYTSIDGEQWRQSKAQATGTVNKILNIKDKIYASGPDDILVFENQGWVSLMASPRFNSIAFGNGQLIGVGANGLVGKSVDGGKKWNITWRSDYLNLKHVWFTRNRWIASGDGVLLSSKDGDQWSKSSLANAQTLNSVATDGRRLVATAEDDNAVWISSDGERWERITPTVSTLAELNKVIYISEKWIAIGKNGRITVSKDGLSWVEADSNHQEDLVDLAGSGRFIVAVGNKGVFNVFGYQGEVWQAGQMGQDDLSLTAVLSHEGVWAAVESNGRILFSLDGRTWQAGFSKDETLNSLFHDGRRWIVGGPNGGYWSTNGVDWAPILDLDELNEVASGGQPENSTVLLGNKRIYHLSESAGMIGIAGVTISALLDKVTLDLTGDLSRCNKLVALVRGQSDRSYSTDGLRLRSLTDAIELSNSSGNRASLKVDLKSNLGLTWGDSFIYSVALNCHSFAAIAEKRQIDATAFYPSDRPIAKGTYLDIVKNPPYWFVAGLSLLSILLIATLLFILHPLSLFWVRARLAGPGTWREIKIPFLGVSIGQTLQLIDGGMVRFFAERVRTQDAWVKKHWRRWADFGFESTPLATRAMQYLPLPIKVSGGRTDETIETPDSSLLSQLFAEINYIQVIGVGGAGKSTLAMQMARWCLDEGTAPMHVRRLPILIDEEAADLSSLLSIIRRKFRSALNFDLDDTYLRLLLRSGRIVPIFDRLSEKNDSSFQFAERLAGHVDVRLAIFTSRRALVFEGVRSATIFALPLRKRALMSFMTALLATKGLAVRDTSVADQRELIDHLVKMITVDGEEQPLTPLLVNIFVEHALELLRSGQGLDALPESIPEAYFSYLRRANPTQMARGLSEKEMLKSCRVLAVSCLGASFTPRELDFEVAIEKLKIAGVSDPDFALQCLASNGVLISKASGARSYIAFALDPVAEYLAASEMIHKTNGDGAALAALFAEVEQAGISAMGFFRALKIVVSTRSEGS